LISDEARIVNLPEVATIRVFTLDGTLIRTINKNSTDTSISWDLTTDEGLPMASGMYLVHVDAPELNAEKVIKFGFIKKRIQLDLF
jgi:predicted secreted protein